MRPCLDCGTPATGTRCPAHQRQLDAKRNARRTWYHGDWDRRSRDARAAHLAEHGPVCLGYQRPAHPVDPADLQLDHTTGRVLCRWCNVDAGPAPR